MGNTDLPFARTALCAIARIFTAGIIVALRAGRSVRKRTQREEGRQATAFLPALLCLAVVQPIPIKRLLALVLGQRLLRLCLCLCLCLRLERWVSSRLSHPRHPVNRGQTEVTPIKPAVSLFSPESDPRARAAASSRQRACRTCDSAACRSSRTRRRAAVSGSRGEPTAAATVRRAA